jgi:PglZ domain
VNVALQLGPVSAHVRDRLSRLLDEHRIVVWYDTEHAFGDSFLARIDLPNCKTVSGSTSALAARRDAERFYRQLGEPDQPAQAQCNLLIYVPNARGTTPEAQQADPFEVFARIGSAFGDEASEHLDSLARVALHDRLADVERLFRESRPTLELLDGLRVGERFPLVRQALGTDNGLEVAVSLLGRADAGQRIQGVPGALPEAQRLLHAELGLPEGPVTWPALADRLALYLLASELHFDLRDGLPQALAGVPHAGDSYRDIVLAACERWRETEEGRESFLSRARQVERDLRLAAVFGADPPLGTRDTFPLHEPARLKAIGEAAEHKDLVRARALFDRAKNSPWRRDPERQVLWRAAQRCLEFLELAENCAAKPTRRSSSVANLVADYTVADGLWRLDRAQRLFEQAAAQCAQDNEIDSLVHACRARYRELVDPVQTAFQAAVKAGGWPPEDTRQQRATFHTRVTPELEARRRTAYFLVDALRYEMGRDLAEALEDFGSVSVDAAANVLPTTTPCGMAALMPGAESAYEYQLIGGDLVPVVAGTPLPGASERIAYLRKQFGDRYHDLTLGEILSTPQKKLGQRIASADFAVIRTQDIDAAGEGPSLFRARKVMSDVLGELRVAAQRLIGLGFQTLVFSADHGHVLLPEVPAGDVLPSPPGDWKARKRRSLLGKSLAQTPGVLVLRSDHVGIVAPPDLADFATASGFKTFQGGEGYFHEGLSLQECIVPVVVLRSSGAPASAAAASGAEQVTIAYRSNRFTSSVIGLKLMLASSPMFSDTVAVRLEAFASREAKAQIVGRAAECDAYDQRTGEVLLHAGQETQVPLSVESDFSGASIDIRATDPRTGAVLGRLSLKNGRME